MEDSVPIIEITDENFEAMFPIIKDAINEASFIALDCELSGLGDRSKLNYSEIDMRYQYTKDIVQEYAIVSMGVSCFTCQSCSSLTLSEKGKDKFVKTHNYLVQTFNILTLCSTKYVVECNSVKFLLSHGFNFNKQFSHGLLYARGEDTQSLKNGESEKLSVKSVFHLIIKYCKPIVLHNGFVDLMFLYQSFYADLPKKLEMFAADLLEMFPAGVYDTKYISEFKQSLSATFLEFVFKRLQLVNEEREKNGKWHCRIKFPSYPKKGVAGLDWYPYLGVFEDKWTPDSSVPLCLAYKFHGWCPKGKSCEMSHNVNRMVKEICTKKRKKVHYVGNSSVAQLINIKKQKIEESLKELNRVKTSKPIVDSSSKVSDIVVLGEEGDKDSLVVHKNTGRTTNDQEPLTVPEDLIDISGEDHENDITILEDNDEDSVQEVFSEKENIPSSPMRPSSCNSNNEYSGNYTTEEPFRTTNDTNSASSHQTYECNLVSPDSDQEENPCENGNSQSSNRGHNAGYDAFMTGFIFACDVAELGHLTVPSSFKDPKEMQLHHVSGNVYLIGKDFPFLIRNSDYTTTSAAHNRLIQHIRSS